MLRACLFGLIVAFAPAAAIAQDPLIVHEWGTFTALQDEQGRALGRINTDDEPVPAFVHQMANASMFPPTVAFTESGKGVPAGDPLVTMRLETPVLYFHVPPGERMPRQVDVEVAFHGGWLTQYFPDARAAVEGTKPGELLPPLSSATVGKLAWKGLIINGDAGKTPETSENVWTAPRAVQSAPVTVGPEREQFLFYRGVGHVDAPVRVLRHGTTLEVQRPAGGSTGPLWLVDIRPDGTLAFRRLGEWPERSVLTTAATFAANEYAARNLGALRSELKGELVSEGLFADEADALLNTWQHSYFQNPGERLFFMVPQEWTQTVLPLKVSGAAQVTRVMVGRIELVTPEQRDLLRKMSLATAEEVEAVKPVAAAMNTLRNDASRTRDYNALAGGHGQLESLGVPVPPLYRDYLALGRFRTALVLNEPQGKLMNLSMLLTP